MNRRRNEGAETFSRLLEWDRGSAAAERLASQLLRFEGYKSIDPSHPLGGPDRLKDIICEKGQKKWIGGVYFPRGQKKINEIKKKLEHDVLAVDEHGVDGFILITNQEIKLGEREELRELAGEADLQVLHLERISSILDTPECYGVRLEYLDIEMTKEEQLAYISSKDKVIDDLHRLLNIIVSKLEDPDVIKNLSLEDIKKSVPLSEIKEFKQILDSISSYDPFVVSTFTIGRTGHIRDLRVPLIELKEFAEILDRITGTRYISTIFDSGHVYKLNVPLSDLKEYEAILDRIIQKLREKKALE